MNRFNCAGSCKTLSYTSVRFFRGSLLCKVGILVSISARFLIDVLAVIALPKRPGLELVCGVRRSASIVTVVLQTLPA